MSEGNDVLENQPFDVALRRFREETRDRGPRRATLEEIVEAIREDRESSER